MFDMNFINDLAKQFSENLPPGVNKFKKELDKNFRTVLQSVFSKLDLVTREEFIIQKGVLAKTHAKISSLEKHVVEWEKHLSKSLGCNDRNNISQNNSKKELHLRH